MAKAKTKKKATKTRQYKRTHTRMTKVVWTAYCNLLGQMGLYRHAAEAAGVSYRSVLDHRKSNKEWATLEEDAMEMFKERLQHEAMRRATGFEEPIIYQGKLMVMLDVEGKPMEDPEGKPIALTVTTYDSQLLQTMLKGRIPDVFGPKAEVEHIHKGGVIVLPAPISRQEWEKQLLELHDEQIESQRKLIEGS